jgi:wyosine [tRNA(Phe)-imidazoG37] synthetase (radical SAM superfamily)
VALCGCPGWGDLAIGNIFETPLIDLLSSPKAAAIRESVITGTYEFCNEKICAVINNNELNTKETLPDNVSLLLQDSTKFDLPYEIKINGDRTCNLSCPSCRTSIYKSSEDEIANQQKLGQILFNNIFDKPSDKLIMLSTSGSGEVFASPMLLNLLANITLDKFPNFKLELHTNGLLSQKFWHKIRHLESAIEKIVVSIDAASKETYETVRRGGKWEDLQSSLDFLKIMKHKIKFKFNGRLIFQKENYKEAVDFYHFCKSYNIDRVEYSRLIDFGSWNKLELQQRDVLHLTHDERPMAVKQIQQLQLLPNVWFEGNFE